MIAGKMREHRGDPVLRGPTHLGLSLDRHITHDDLAALVGASRVMVSNAMGGLRETGLVLVDGQRRFVVSQALLNEAGAFTDPASPITTKCVCFRKWQVETEQCHIRTRTECSSFVPRS